MIEEDFNKLKNIESGKSFIEDIGFESPRVGLVACTHGNEQVGLAIHDYARSLKLKHGSLRLIVANVQAALENKRFIDTDLNRSFPGEGNGLEATIACQLIPYLQECDYLLDFHSTTATTLEFTIVRSNIDSQADLARMTGANYHVVKGGKGQSSIDYAKVGVGLELGTHGSPITRNRGINRMIDVLKSLGMIEGYPSRPKSNFLDGNEEIQRPEGFEPNKNVLFNFNRITKGEKLGDTPEGPLVADEEFYPILYGEVSYGNVLCWKGVQIS